MKKIPALELFIGYSISLNTVGSDYQFRVDMVNGYSLH